MAVHAVLVSRFDDDRRAAPRQDVNRASTLRDESSYASDVQVRDLSETGFSVETPVPLAIGSTVSIGLPGHGRATARVVRPVEAGCYGCEFATPLTQAALARMFDGDTVVQLSVADPLPAAGVGEDARRLPGAVRLLAIVGGSALLWAGIIALAARLF